MENATFGRMNYAGAGVFRKSGMLLAVLGAALACTRTGAPLDTGSNPPENPAQFSTPPFAESFSPSADPTAFQPATATPAGQPTAFSTPTLDPTRFFSMPTLGPGSYTVQSGDTIGSIAWRFGVAVEALINVNSLANPNALEIEQVLLIPVPDSETQGPNFKIIPDSELVYGPVEHDFSVAEFLKGRQSYLAGYRETVVGLERSGAEIVDYVAWHYSVNPRMLLAVLEYRSHWISSTSPSEDQKVWPILHIEGKPYLYKQLAWVADQLNSGYYKWKAGGGDYWFLADGTQIRSGSGINAGTAGVQNLMAQMYTRADWEIAVTQDGFFQTYQSMFGYPFSWALEPIVPATLVQPALILPFEPGVIWYFTSGPHGGWGSGSAFAALDFGPGDVDSGCLLQSNYWVTAAAPGLVVRSEEGGVVLDLDMDGNEQTNWVLFYMHIETRDRVAKGTVLKAGDRIGHASCEGGVSNGTHVHFARKFNGEWISAEGPVPLVLDGWVASNGGREYDGYLKRDSVSIEAKGWSAEDNIIQR